MTSNPVWLWWSLLCAMACLNMAAWVWSAARWRAERPQLDAATVRLRRQQLMLAAGYVAGCAWRSFVPVFDVPRQTLFDAWWSSALVGRSVATVAELCFAAQWALVLREASQLSHGRRVLLLARIIVPLTVVAEICSWYSVLSTSNLGHVFEESIWCVNAAAVALALAWTVRHVDPRWRSLLRTGAGAAAVYAVYLATVDVPMYATRWLATEAQSTSYLGLTHGAVDALTRRVVSHDWASWRGEVVWMTLYFSVGVWFSLALTRLRAPRLERRSADLGAPRHTVPMLP